MTMEIINEKVERFTRWLEDANKRLSDAKKCRKAVAAYAETYHMSISLTEWDNEVYQMELEVKAYKAEIAKAKKAAKLLAEVEELTA